jgi:hypothetical protein
MEVCLNWSGKCEHKIGTLTKNKLKGQVQKWGGSISGHNLVLHCFIYIKNCPIYWLKNGVAKVISYTVKVRMDT